MYVSPGPSYHHALGLAAAECGEGTSTYYKLKLQLLTREPTNDLKLDQCYDNKMITLSNIQFVNLREV